MAVKQSKAGKEGVLRLHFLLRFALLRRQWATLHLRLACFIACAAKRRIASICTLLI
jgi:hypothetical protein